MYQGLHVTTNFHVIKKWVESCKGIPAATIADGKKMPAVAFGDVDCPGWEEVSWIEFFDLLTRNDLAFAFEESYGDLPAAGYFKFVPWEKYPDEVMAEAKMEDKKERVMMIAQTVFS